MRPPKSAKRHPAGGGAAMITGNEIAAQKSHQPAQVKLCSDPCFRRLTNRLWRLGARLTGELLLESAAAQGSSPRS
jgi:hypothetical protein